MKDYKLLKSILIIIYGGAPVAKKAAKKLETKPEVKKKKIKKK